jgi:tetratricopeptide (TPR) repeat protein
MERRLAVHAGAHRQMKRLRTAIVVALALVAGSAAAAPKDKAAKKEFDKGVAAYTKGDFTGAADAFSKSDAIESDAETLFAWAQSERKLDQCGKALELYTRLLALDLPDENKQAVNVQIGECKDIIAAQKPPEPVASPPDEPPPPPPEGRAWWKDPVGGALVGLGAVGVGVGVVFLVQGHSADTDKASATTYPAFKTLDDRAKSRGQLGVISLAAGGALVIGGIAWYATHKSSSHEKIVTGWLDGHGGGIGVAGAF